MTTQADAHRLVSAPIVVGVDGSAAAELAVRWAADLAAHCGRELLLVHGLGSDTNPAITAQYEQMMPKFVETVHHRGAEAVVAAHRIAREIDPYLTISTEVSTAHPTRLLLDYADSAHLVVLGESGNHQERSHVGSTLLAVTRHAAGPVVVVRDTGTEWQIRAEGPVVVGIDGSPVSEVAIGAAFAEASQRGAYLVAVHVWSDLNFGRFAGGPRTIVPPTGFDVSEQAILAERLAGWQEKYPDVTIVRKIYLAGPFVHLLEWSYSAQLVVVGSCGRGAVSTALLGSTSGALVQHAHCPVMVVHPEA